MTDDGAPSSRVPPRPAEGEDPPAGESGGSVVPGAVGALPALGSGTADSSPVPEQDGTPPGDAAGHAGTTGPESAAAVPDSPDDLDDPGDGAGADAREDGDEADDHGRLRRTVRTALEWAGVIGGALLVAVVVKTFLIQAFWIPSPSMVPTLRNNDRVLANKLADDVDDIHRGDVVVFNRVEGGGNGPGADIEDLIKRVIGLPGDVIEARDGVVYVNGQRLDEPYLSPGTRTTGLDRVEVPDGEFFVMGDNRGHSHDSRMFGPVPEENLVGRAFVRIWPLSRLGEL